MKGEFKMKKINKLLSVLLVALTLFSVVSAGGAITASATYWWEGEDKSNSDFVYRVSLDDEVMLLKAKDKDYTGKTFVFPATVEGKKVVGAGYGFLDDLRKSGNADTITSIKVEEGVEKISATYSSDEEEDSFDDNYYYIFAGLKNLKNVSLPSTLKWLDRGLFSGCTSLKKIYIPDSVVLLDDNVFSNCTALEDVRLSKNIDIISYRMFYNCTALKKITIPDSVTYIYPLAFENCTSLKKITISDNVTDIYSGAFKNCKSLEPKFKLPKNLKNIYNPFIGCEQIDGFRVDKDSKNFTVKSGVLFSKDMKVLESYPIGKKSKKYTVPSSVTYISEGSFYGAKYLEKVTLSEKTETIGGGAFKNCKALKGTFKITKKVKDIGRCVFENCNGVTALKIDKKNKHFAQTDGVLMSKDKKKIYFCLPSAKIKEFKVPSTVKSVEYAAFAGTKNLKKVTFTKRCTIGDYLFEGSNIKSVVFAKNQQNLGIGTFLNCKKLESVNIPSKVIYIKHDTFNGCKKLKSVKIPSGVYRIGSRAFKNCKSLKEIKLPSTVKYIGNETFYGCGGIKSLTFPKSVERIGENTFANCKNLKTVRFNGNNVSIEKSDLKGSGIVIHSVKPKRYWDSPKQLAKDNGLKFVTIRYN